MFDTLVGNKAVKEILQRLLASKRIPNALLFAGAEGVGKKQFALQLAKAFVCQDPQQLEACDKCAACRRADVFVFPKPDAKGEDYDEVFFSEHPDVGMAIPFNRNLRVGAIRQLEREANFLPYEAQARCFIIEDADKMTDAASNALLKTLEEPPATSYIFLISARPDTLLPTIRSRCQMIRFSSASVAEIEQHLIQASEMSATDAALAARFSEGSVGQALTRDVEKLRQQRELILSLVRSVIQKADAQAVLRVSEQMNEAKNKDDFEVYLDVLEKLIHDIWNLRLGGSREKIINVDVISELEKFAENAEPKKLAIWLEEIEAVRENLIVNINKKIATDALFMQMAV
jgi:DNA polymerase III subunit delta'